MGFIKLDRKLLSWGWKDNPLMVALWIEILLQANYYDGEWHGEMYEEGSFPTSIDKLSKATGLTVRQVRTCLDRLKKTKELTIESTNRGTKIIVNKWHEYQCSGDDNDKQNDKRSTNDRQTIDNTIRRKKERTEREIQKDIADLDYMGFADESNTLRKYCSMYSPDYQTYLKIKDAVFDPNIRHLDQYVEKIMKGTS